MDSSARYSPLLAVSTNPQHHLELRRTLQQARRPLRDVLDERLPSAIYDQAVQWRCLLVCRNGISRFRHPISPSSEQRDGISRGIFQQKPTACSASVTLGTVSSLEVKHTSHRPLRRPSDRHLGLLGCRGHSMTWLFSNSPGGRAAIRLLGRRGRYCSSSSRDVVERRSPAPKTCQLFQTQRLQDIGQTIIRNVMLSQTENRNDSTGSQLSKRRRGCWQHPSRRCPASQEAKFTLPEANDEPRYGLICLCFPFLVAIWANCTSFVILHGMFCVFTWRSTKPRRCKKRTTVGRCSLAVCLDNGSFTI